MTIVVLGGKLVVTIGWDGMSGGFVRGRVDDEETIVWGDGTIVWIDEAERWSVDKISYWYCMKAFSKVYWIWFSGFLSLSNSFQPFLSKYSSK